MIRIDSSGQFGLFRGMGKRKGKGRGRYRSKGEAPRHFEDPSPRRILIGNESLEEFLIRAGQSRIFQIRQMLRSLQWGGFEAKYRGGGRRPYHPAALLGLILFGIMEGKSSLRQLETMARTDVRSWWLTGGITPDHSVIGRFLNDHAQRLSQEFFESLTREVLKVTRSSTQSVAGDGTVVQAAASRYRGVKQEAAEEAAQESRGRAESDPENEKLARQAEQAECVAEAVRDRVATRKRQRSKNAQDAKVSPSEPEAVIQPLKDKSIAPSYKPTLLANGERIIVGQQVQASSETRGFGALLRQAKRINGGVKQLLLDAGFFVGKVMDTALEEGVEDLLCPEGGSRVASGERKSSKGFAKSAFHYDEQRDCYKCPAGEELLPLGQSHDDGKSFTRYGGAPCQHCEFREQCTSNPRGRTVKRYQDDEIKDVLREVMRHPAAQREYSRRKGMVEPVFSELKGIQGLQRFRRRGLEKVRLEFALHATAHNLRRLVVLTQASEKALERISGAFWQLLQLPIGLFQGLRLFCSRFSGEHLQNSSLHSCRVTV